MRAYFDADVLIWHLRGEKKALKFFQDVDAEGTYEWWTGAMQRAEVLFFMRPNEEEQTLLFMSRFKTAPVTQKVVDQAGILYRKWNPTHGIDPNDALLSATVQETGGHLFTMNKKHFPMKELSVSKAWR